MLLLTLLLSLVALSALGCGSRKSSKKNRRSTESTQMTAPRSASSETTSTVKKSLTRTPCTPQTPLSEDDTAKSKNDYMPPKGSMTYVKSLDRNLVTCKSKAQKQLKVDATQRTLRATKSKENLRSKTRKTQRGKADEIMSDCGVSNMGPENEMIIGEYEQLIPADKEKEIIATYDTQASTIISEDYW